MKILNLCPFGVPLYNDLGGIFGGREKVVIEIHRLLRSQGVEIVTLVRQSDSRMFADEGTLVRPDEHFDRTKMELTLLSVIDAVSPTHIICHGEFPVLRVLVEHGIRCMFIDHQMYYSINNKSWEHYYGRVSENKKLGGSLYDVSDFSVMKKKEALEYRSGIPYDLYDGSIRLQHPTQELMQASAQEATGVPCFIGRFSVNKNINAAGRWSKQKLIPDFLVMSNSRNMEQKIWDAAVKTYPEFVQKTRFDVPRPELMRTLASAPFSLVTSPYESAGIAAFESLCLGVPILCAVMSNTTHASKEFVPPDFHHLAYAQVSVGDAISDPDFVSRCLSMTVETRAMIREAVLEYNSVEKCVASLMSKLNKMESV